MGHSFNNTLWYFGGITVNHSLCPLLSKSFLQPSFCILRLEENSMNEVRSNSIRLVSEVFSEKWEGFTYMSKSICVSLWRQQLNPMQHLVYPAMFWFIWWMYTWGECEEEDELYLRPHFLLRWKYESIGQGSGVLQTSISRLKLS